MKKLKLCVAILFLFITHQTSALDSSCRLYQTRPAHVVTWGWLDTIIYDHVFVLTEAAWTGGADALDTFHTIQQSQPVVHWMVNPKPNTPYAIFGGSSVFSYYPYLGRAIGKSDSCFRTLFTGG